MSRNVFINKKGENYEMCLQCYFIVAQIVIYVMAMIAGNRLTRFFSGLGRKKPTPTINDSDDADVESPTVPVSPESQEHLVEEDAELGNNGIII